MKLFKMFSNSPRDGSCVKGAPKAITSSKLRKFRGSKKDRMRYNVMRDREIDELVNQIFIESEVNRSEKEALLMNETHRLDKEIFGE